MCLIAVDIGNSSTKFALANASDGEIRPITSFNNDIAIEANGLEWLDSRDPFFWSVCSVHAQRADELKRWVNHHRKQDQFHLIQHDDIPLPSDVESRQSLGRDRLLGAWQARQLYSRGRLVVIDAGTAVTVDLVRSDSVFAGGVIFPGARTMLRMLAAQTSALPDLSNAGIKGAFDREHIGPSFPSVGRSTNKAILTGVYQTQLSALQNIVTSIESQSIEPLQVIATGGGFGELQPWLPDDWFFDPLLLLRGALSIGRKLITKK